MDKIVFLKKGQPMTTSRLVARKFGKEHKDVMRSIKNLDCSIEFSRRNFALSNYRTRGKEYPEYYITRDGFTFLVMGFTGARAAAFKEEYIGAFNKMEKKLTQPMSAEELIVSQAKTLLNHKRRMNRLESRVKVIEAKSQTRVEDYFTVAGFASLKGRSINITEAATLGKKATKLCHERGIPIDKIHDPRFGYVGSYPKKVLTEIM